MVIMVKTIYLFLISSILFENENEWQKTKPVLIPFPRASKAVFFCQCSKMQLISFKKIIIKTCFIQFLWFFRLKCWLKGRIISRIHLSLPKEYKLMYFSRNNVGYRDDKFFEWYYLSLQWPKKLTLETSPMSRHGSTVNLFTFVGPILVDHTVQLALHIKTEWTLNESTTRYISR